MKGIPARFNTLDDVKNSMSVDPAATKEKLRALLENRFCWVATGEVAGIEAGVTDETHKVVETTKEGDEAAVIFVQYERREDPNAWMFKLGLTVNSINAFLEA